MLSRTPFTALHHSTLRVKRASYYRFGIRGRRMLAGELLSIAEDMVHDYESLEVLPTLQAAVNLAANRYALSPKQFSDQLAPIKESARNIVKHSTARHYSLELKRRLTGSSFGQALPDAMARVVLIGLKDRKDDGGHISSAELQLYLDEASRFYRKMLNLIEASEAFGVEKYPNADGFVSLQIHLPDRVYGRKLRDLAERLRRFDRLLSVLNELGSGSREDIKVQWASTSDLVVAVSIGSVSVGCFFYAYGQLLNVVERHLSIVKMLRELRVSGAAPDTVEASLRASETSSLEKAVAEILQRFGGNLPKGRRNELEKELKSTAEAVIADFAAGARLRLDPRDQKELTVDELQDDGNAHAMAPDQIERRDAMEAKLDVMLDVGGHEALGLISVRKDDGILPR